MIPDLEFNDDDNSNFLQKSESENPERTYKIVDEKNLYTGKGFLNPETNKILFNNKEEERMAFRFKQGNNPLDQFYNPSYFVSLFIKNKFFIIRLMTKITLL